MFSGLFGRKKKKEDPSSKYASQLKELEKKGYKDKKKNLEMLQMYQGNVKLVLMDYDIEQPSSGESSPEKKKPAKTISAKPMASAANPVAAPKADQARDKVVTKSHNKPSVAKPETAKPASAPEPKKTAPLVEETKESKERENRTAQGLPVLEKNLKGLLSHDLRSLLYGISQENLGEVLYSRSVAGTALYDFESTNAILASASQGFRDEVSYMRFVQQLEKEFAVNGARAPEDVADKDEKEREEKTSVMPPEMLYEVKRAEVDMSQEDLALMTAAQVMSAVLPFHKELAERLYSRSCGGRQLSQLDYSGVIQVSGIPKRKLPESQWNQIVAALNLPQTGASTQDWTAIAKRQEAILDRIDKVEENVLAMEIEKRQIRNLARIEKLSQDLERIAEQRGIGLDAPVRPVSAAELEELRDRQENNIRRLHELMKDVGAMKGSEAAEVKLKRCFVKMKPGQLRQVLVEAGFKQLGDICAKEGIRGSLLYEPSNVVELFGTVRSELTNPNAYFSFLQAVEKDFIERKKQQRQERKKKGKPAKQAKRGKQGKQGKQPEGEDEKEPLVLLDAVALREQQQKNLDSLFAMQREVDKMTLPPSWFELREKQSQVISTLETLCESAFGNRLECMGVLARISLEAEEASFSLATKHKSAASDPRGEQRKPSRQRQPRKSGQPQGQQRRKVDKASLESLRQRQNRTLANMRRLEAQIQDFAESQGIPLGKVEQLSKQMVDLTPENFEKLQSRQDEVMARLLQVAKTVAGIAESQGIALPAQEAVSQAVAPSLAELESQQESLIAKLAGLLEDASILSGQSAQDLLGPPRPVLVHRKSGSATLMVPSSFAADVHDHYPAEEEKTPKLETPEQQRQHSFDLSLEIGHTRSKSGSIVVTPPNETARIAQSNKRRRKSLQVGVDQLESVFRELDDDSVGTVDLALFSVAMNQINVDTDTEPPSCVGGVLKSVTTPESQIDYVKFCEYLKQSRLTRELQSAAEWEEFRDLVRNQMKLRTNLRLFYQFDGWPKGLAVELPDFVNLERHFESVPLKALTTHVERHFRNKLVYAQLRYGEIPRGARKIAWTTVSQSTETTNIPLSAGEKGWSEARLWFRTDKFLKREGGIPYPQDI